MVMRRGEEACPNSGVKILKSHKFSQKICDGVKTLFIYEEGTASERLSTRIRKLAGVKFMSSSAPPRLPTVILAPFVEKAAASTPQV
jgi:hypothetical protein